VLCAAIIISGREGQTVQKSFGATIEILKVDDTAIDEQPSLVGLNENGVKTTIDNTGKTTENITGKTTTKEDQPAVVPPPVVVAVEQILPYLQRFQA